MYQTIHLSKLRPGHEYPGANINSRSIGRDEIEAKRKSIESWGLLQPLLVCPDPAGGDGFFVIAGNKRLAALKELAGGKKNGAAIPGIDLSTGIPVLVRSDVTPGSALAMSLAENEDRENLHPAELYERYAELTARGFSEADIANKFHKPAALVKKILALGALSPTIRKAWSEGKLRDEAVKAFTLSNDHARQDAVYKKLTKERGIYAGDWEIRRALLGDQEAAAGMLKFVGEAEYKKAGGHLIADLFADDRNRREAGAPVISDTGLLETLASKKAGAVVETLKSKGWGWIEFADKLPDEWKWNWPKTPSAPKAMRAKLGVVLEFDRSAAEGLKRYFGVGKGAGKKAVKVVEEAAATAKKAKAQTMLSGALKDRLERSLLAATREALISDAMGSNEHAKIAPTLAAVVAAQINPERRFAPDAIEKKLDAIRALIPTAVLDAALRKHFDAKDYFSGAPKPIVLRAIEEAMGAEHAKKLKAKTKAEIWKFALANIPKTGWLPKEMGGASAKKGKKK